MNPVVTPRFSGFSKLEAFPMKNQAAIPVVLKVILAFTVWQALAVGLYATSIPVPSAIGDQFNIVSGPRDVGDLLAGTKPDTYDEPGGVWKTLEAGGIQIGTGGIAISTASGNGGVSILNVDATRYIIQADVLTSPGGGGQNWTGFTIGPNDATVDTAFQLRNSGNTYVFRGAVLGGEVTIPSFNATISHLLQVELDFTNLSHVQAKQYVDGTLYLTRDLGAMTATTDLYVGFRMATAGGTVDNFAVIVPEPSALLLLILGGLGVAVWRFEVIRPRRSLPACVRGKSP
jgi:hypothetical protein